MVSTTSARSLGDAAVPINISTRASANARIAVPTLVLCGTDDRITPPELSEELAGLIPGARLEMIDDAGHLANAEQPTAFNAALDKFLAEAEKIFLS